MSPPSPVPVTHSDIRWAGEPCWSWDALEALSSTASRAGVLFEVINPTALPHSLTAHYGTLLELARVYKMINAPFGDLGRNSLVVSTAALASNTTGDATYNNLEAKIASWHTRRDSLANQMKSMLEGAAFSGQTINERPALQVISQGQALLNEVSACVANIPVCAQ